MLSPGYHDVPKGHLPCVVTHLEMRAPPPLDPVPLPDGVVFRHVPSPDAVWYRDLFRRVGGQDWLWVSRLALPLGDLTAILSNQDVVVIAVEHDGTAQGLLELDFREAGACELAFFGLTAPLIGQGVGRALMNLAIQTAFDAPIRRFVVHTCTLDHPEALGFYRRSGFAPLRQQIEILPDPRLSGVLPSDAGARWPIIRE